MAGWRRRNHKECRIMMIRPPRRTCLTKKPRFASRGGRGGDPVNRGQTATTNTGEIMGCPARRPPVPEPGGRAASTVGSEIRTRANIPTARGKYAKTPPPVFEQIPMVVFVQIQNYICTATRMAGLGLPGQASWTFAGRSDMVKIEANFPLALSAPIST